MPKPRTPRTPKPPAAKAEPYKDDGFGGFAEVYRARWQATHPNNQPADTAPSNDADSDAQTSSSDDDEAPIPIERGMRGFRRIK